MADTGHRALIVTLGRSRGSLAAVRALGAAGWEIGVGTPDGQGMVTASRSCARRHVVPRPRGDGTAFSDAVRRAVEDGGYDVVFGGADDWMAALATYRDQIPTRVAHPPAEVVARVLDKIEVTRLARDAGMHAPWTVPATDETIANWGGPVVVKCRTHWAPGQRHDLRIEAKRFDTISDAKPQIASLRDAGFDPVLQEAVRGRLHALVGLFHQGRLLGRVQQIATRLWPTPSGVSSRAVTVPVDEKLAQGVERLLGNLGWNGLIEVQFLADETDRLHLIDLNGRFYGSMALALHAGSNLADAWGRQALGEPLPALIDGEPDVRYVWLAGDLRRALVERRGGLLADAWATFRNTSGAATSVWDRHDIGPVRDLLTTRFRRLFRASAS